MTTADPTPAAVPPPPPRPRRRRWLRVLLAVVLLAIVGVAGLVALAPTLLGTRPVVGLILRQVDARLNGHVEVADVSLGWLTGVRLDGVRVFDDADVQVAQVDHVTCPMPLWRAATGHYPLGTTVVDGLAFDARVDSQGRLNLTRLAKSNPSSPTNAPANAKPAAPSQPSKLPDVSGTLQLKNARGTVARSGKPTLYLTRLDGEVKVPNLDQPITNHLEATAKAGDGPEGHITADGTAAAIKAGRVDLDSANVHQTADAKGLDLAAAKPFVQGLDTLAGMLDAHLAVDVTDGKSAALDATITGTQPVKVGGPLLKGDTFATNTFVAAVPKLSAAFPDGLGHWQTGRVQVGADGGAGPILFKVDQGQLTVVVDAVPQAVLNLADHKAPGIAGRVEIADHFDAGKIVAQLKNSAHLSDAATLTGGTLDQSIKLTLTPDRGTVHVNTDLTGVAGTRNGQPVHIEPVHLTVAGTDRGGANLLDGLRDLDLKLSSKFANADFHGSTVGNLTGTLTAQLQSLQAEAAQLVDFGGKQLAGDVAAHIVDTGDLMQGDRKASVKADVTVTDLRYADRAGPRVAQPRVAVTLTGDLQGSASAAVASARNLRLTAQAGPADAPTVDVAVAVPTATLGDSPSADFQLTKLRAELAPLQKQFANLPPGQAGIVCGGGALTGTSSGHYGADGVRLDLTHLSLAQLVVQKQLATGQTLPVVSNDTFDLSAAGTVGLGDAKTVRLSDLSLADTGKIVDVHKGDGELTLTQSKAGMAGRGTLAVMVELGRVNDLLRAVGQTTVTAQTPAGRVKSGRLSGTLAFVAAASGRTDINGRFDVPDLDVATAGGDSGPQQASLVIKGSSDQSAHTITADEASFRSPFATLAVTNGSVLLSAPSTVDQLQKATLAVDVPDLKTAAALLQSFSPPPPPKPAATAAPPLVVTGGSLSVHADVSHDGNNLVLSVPTASANNVAFTRGSAAYQAKPITAKLTASVGTAAGTSLAQQIRGLKVSQLDANAGVATVSLTSPVVVTDLSNPAASATGGIKVDGELADIAQLLGALQAKPADAYPYRGHLTVTQKLSPDAAAVVLQGAVQVAKFQVMQGQSVQFAEDELSVTNDVAVPPKADAVGIRSLAVAMKSSGALNVTVSNGRVDDLSGERRLKLPVQLQYDLAKLWPIVHPILLTPGQPDPYADVKVSGAFTKSLTVGGSYPAGVPFTAAVKPLTVDADLAVASFEHSGLTVKNLDLPVTLRDGKAVTTYPDGRTAPAATVNDGQGDFGNVTVDLTQDPMRVSMPAGKALLTRVTINPLFTNTFLNDYINNPVFVGTRDATGLLDVTVVKCDRFPAGGLAQQAVRTNDGVLTLRFSLTDLHIGGAGAGAIIAKLVTHDPDQPDSFTANVKDATVTLAGGVATQDLTFQTGKYAVPFTGDVVLTSKAFRNFSVGLPGATIASRLTKDPNVLNRMPAVVSVPLTGTLTAPVPNVGGAAQKLLSNPNTLADIIGGQLNKKNGNGNGTGGNSANNGQNGQSNDPLSNLLNGLNKKKKKK